MYHGALNFVQEIKIKDVIHGSECDVTDAGLCDHGNCFLAVGVRAMARLSYLHPCLVRIINTRGSRGRRALSAVEEASSVFIQPWYLDGRQT